MSWKTGKRPLTEAGTGSARRWSIARRLALLHILAVLVSYSIFGAVFYQKRLQLLAQGTLADLAAERGSVVAMMQQPDGRVLLAYEIRTQQFEPESLRPFIRILDRNGQILLESPWQGSVIPREAFPEPGSVARWRNGKGYTYLIETVPLPESTFSGLGSTLQLGVNNHDEAEFGRDLRLNLLAFIASGIVFAFGCALLIVRLAMKPLDDVSRTASNITRHRLDTRIDDRNLPAELVSLAHSFNSMLRRLEDSFSRLSHYSGNLAHELRTPINTLMIEADIALAKERSPQEYRQVIASSLEEYGRLSWTIDRLLFLARADLETQDLDRQRLQVAEEIEDIFDYFFDTACESGVTLELTGTATLYADQTLFRRAISNLLSNAIAYTPVAGAVTVSVSQLEGGAVRVTVSDDGCGIEAEHLPRLFDRFYRAESGRARKTEGSGLGLAIVKTIMQMHGGSIELQSEVGVGTKVTLEFPPYEPPVSQ